MIASFPRNSSMGLKLSLLGVMSPVLHPLQIVVSNPHAGILAASFGLNSCAF